MPNRPVCSVLCCGLVAFVCAGRASAQYATAPNNYYPEGYHGATFTGTITQINNDTLALTFTHGNKTDAFEGYVATQCNIPPSVKKGAVITVLYEPETTNERGVYYCIAGSFPTYFKAFQ
jgi:hypothetical protein